MPVPINTLALQTMSEKVDIVYRNVPFYLTWTFAVSILLLIILIVVIVYAWFRISLRNRLNVVIHMPDKTRQFHTYKKFVGSNFNIKGVETDKDGKPVSNLYNFRNDAIEWGYFGRYIEYDYGNAEPRKFNMATANLDYTFISSLLNTQLAVDLLLSSKFKEFVKMMLVIIAVGVFLSFVAAGIGAYYSISTPLVSDCNIVLSNKTIETWKVLRTIQ